MKRASGIGHLKPFLPGLEAVLEDPEVSELMINGPGNVWVERGGSSSPSRRRRSPPPRSTGRRSTSRARSGSIRPPARPRRAARRRLAGRHLHSAREPPRGDDDPPVRGPRVLGRGPRRPGRPAGKGVPRRPRHSHFAAEHLGLRRHRLGQDHAAERPDRAAPEEERIVAIEDTLELRIERANCLRFEAGAAGSEAPVSIRDLVRHALRHRPDHIVVGEVRGGEAADLLQALNTGHGGSLTTVHANNASSALSRLASCAMQAGGALPWEVTCRGVVDGIHLVVHMTRRGGRRFVEEALEVKGYDAAANRWLTEPVWRKHDEEPTDKE